MKILKKYLVGSFFWDSNHQDLDLLLVVDHYDSDEAFKIKKEIQKANVGKKIDVIFDTKYIEDEKVPFLDFDTLKTHIPYEIDTAYIRSVTPKISNLK